MCEAGISLVLLGLLLSLASAPGEGKMAFVISSTSFPNGGDIPKKFTCDGADVSPELAWTDPPPGTKASHSSPTILMRPPEPGPTGCYSICRRLSAVCR